jgi:RimJ/RimL family protein N-acetyltransferase
MNSEIKDNLRQAYDNFADEKEKNEQQVWKLDTRQKFLDLLKQSGKKSILEIGAGTGKDSRFFKDNGFEVAAVDLSSEMVKLCREKDLEAYQLDFDNLSELNGTFDAVWAMNCLLHVEKKKLPLVFEEIKKILNKDGFFFMGVYGGENSEGIYEKDFYTPKRFFSFFTDEAIKEEVSKYFEIVSFEKIETERGNLDFQALILKESGEYIGEAGVLSFIKQNKRAVWGYNLLPEYWGKGYATEITKAAVKFMFDEVMAERIEALVMEENIASKKVLEKSGFIREGLLRNYTNINNRCVNVLYYGMIRDDYANSGQNRDCCSA